MCQPYRANQHAPAGALALALAPGTPARRTTYMYKATPPPRPDRIATAPHFPRGNQSQAAALAAHARRGPAQWGEGKRGGDIRHWADHVPASREASIQSSRCRYTPVQAKITSLPNGEGMRGLRGNRMRVHLSFTV